MNRGRRSEGLKKIVAAASISDFTVDICACNRDNCNKAVDLGTRKCHQCSSEEKVFECENPDEEGSEVTCDGYCAIISYSMYQSSSLL